MIHQDYYHTDKSAGARFAEAKRSVNPQGFYRDSRGVSGKEEIAIVDQRVKSGEVLEIDLSLRHILMM